MKEQNWKTKPTDRFVLKWIKLNLSARITLYISAKKNIEPWQITLTSSSLGCIAGLIFGMGLGWFAGILAAGAQILDGVDGQLARLTGKESRAGAFWDSSLDRYADGALVMGMIVYSIRLPAIIPSSFIFILGALALIGSNLISYTSARAETLGMDTGKSTLASKGTRTSVMIIFALASAFWSQAPLIALLYLVIHPNIVVLVRLKKAMNDYGPLKKA